MEDKFTRRHIALQKNGFNIKWIFNQILNLDNSPIT